MAHFTEDMTGFEARKLFFKLNDKMHKNEISMDEFRKAISEYKNISEKIFNREMNEFDTEIDDGLIRLTEDML